MTTDLAERRQFFAEEVQISANLRTPGLVDALANVPRERFLRPGPWTLRGEGDFGGPPRQTPDADPRHVYHNIAIAIDPARQLFNGQPGTLGVWIDALNLTPGTRVLHVGCGLGYYSALMAHCVGPTGRVLALEVDAALASEARANLAMFPWVEVRHGDATTPLGETLDAVIINAGVTHPQDAWLDALASGGRLILPLTVAMEAMGPTIGKGPVVLVTKEPDGKSYAARTVTFVAIYSAISLRDAALSKKLGEILTRNPFPRLNRLRRDSHEQTPSCWIHGDTFCFASD